MRAAIPPFPNTPSWRGAQLKKHRDNFTFTFNTSCVITNSSYRYQYLGAFTHNSQFRVLVIFVVLFHKVQCRIISVGMLMILATN
jgi:hypothetical protein